MKKLKLSELNLGNAEVLTREQLKKVLGGDGGSGGPCQEDKQECNTSVHLNCCTGLECADYKCGYPTMPV